MLWLTDWDWSLFLSALISSTLFPGGSEGLLLYRLQEASSNPYALVFIATAGNVIGSIITYFMGNFGFQLSHRWFAIPEQKIQQAEKHFKRFGTPALLLAWLPIIGDPLCFVAGSLRYHFAYFVSLVCIGKLARYAVFAWVFL